METFRDYIVEEINLPVRKVFAGKLLKLIGLSKIDEESLKNELILYLTHIFDDKKDSFDIYFDFIPFLATSEINSEYNILEKYKNGDFNRNIVKVFSKEHFFELVYNFCESDLIISFTKKNSFMDNILPYKNYILSDRSDIRLEKNVFNCMIEISFPVCNQIRLYS